MHQQSTYTKYKVHWIKLSPIVGLVTHLSRQPCMYVTITLLSVEYTIVE